MKKSTLFTVLSLSAGLFACGDRVDEQSSNPSIIIGENKLQYHLADDRFTNSIGRIARGCTATHIGNGHVLTAGHCVSNSTCNNSSYNITWGFTNNNRSGKLVSYCQEIIAREHNSQRDYAILRYSPAPKEALPININQRPRRGERLSIYSHPNGAPLSWSGYCAHHGEYPGQKFSYQCDTLGGSSGAAVLNARNEIVGVHNLGNRHMQVNAGTYLVDIPLLNRK